MHNCRRINRTLPNLYSELLCIVVNNTKLLQFLQVRLLLSNKVSLMNHFVSSFLLLRNKHVRSSLKLGNNNVVNVVNSDSQITTQILNDMVNEAYGIFIQSTVPSSCLLLFLPL